MSDQHSHTGQTWRLEHDSLGDVRVPADRYWGAQTERARHRFQIGNDPIPLELIHAIACLKRMAAHTNHQLGVLDEQRCQWISEAAREVEGKAGWGISAVLLAKRQRHPNEHERQ